MCAMTTGWERFSTKDGTSAKRVHLWNQYSSETLCDLSVAPHDGSNFEASLSRIALGPIGFIHIKTTAATATCRLATVGGWACDRDDALLMVVADQRSTFQQSRSQVELAPGDLFIRDLTQPWIHECAEGMDRLMVKIPYSFLSSRIADPTVLVDNAMDSNNPMVRMMVSVLQSISQTLESEPQTLNGAIAANLILDCAQMLSHQASHEPNSREDPANNSNVRRKAMCYINRHLEDSELSVTQVATQIGVGQRSLQRAFFEIGETPKQFIQSQRLDRAAATLKRGLGGHTSIFDIALSVGFSDASHFSRTFSRKFGVSPRQYLVSSLPH